MSKILPILACLILHFTNLSGQNNLLTIGHNDWGLCIGNSINCKGIRLNVIDRNINTINGFNFSIYSEASQSNGLKFSIQSSSDKVNGINIAAWGLDDSVSNGLTLATGAYSHLINGIGIGLLGCSGKRMNGLFFSGLIGTRISSSVMTDEINGVVLGIIGGAYCKELDGLAVGGINIIEKQNGVVIGISNETKELHGIQFGIWNKALNNRRLKGFPIVNFNFRKR